MKLMIIIDRQILDKITMKFETFIYYIFIHFQI
jgi:hypothetical protein